MTVYPAIDILNGNAVRLRHGRAEDVTIYGKPIDMAQRWVAGGAEWLHVVDLNGAFDGVPRNMGLIVEIVRAFPDLKLQLGGGIRTMDSLEAAVAAGVHRAVLG